MTLQKNIIKVYSNYKCKVNYWKSKQIKKVKKLTNVIYVNMFVYLFKFSETLVSKYSFGFLSVLKIFFLSFKSDPRFCLYFVRFKMKNIKN